jgi:hypothetical protein
MRAEKAERGDSTVGESRVLLFQIPSHNSHLCRNNPHTFKLLLFFQFRMCSTIPTSQSSYQIIIHLSISNSKDHLLSETLLRPPLRKLSLLPYFPSVFHSSMTSVTPLASFKYMYLCLYNRLGCSESIFFIF